MSKLLDKYLMPGESFFASKYSGYCWVCGEPFKKGDPIAWSPTRGTQKTRHLDCLTPEMQIEKDARAEAKRIYEMVKGKEEVLKYLRPLIAEIRPPVMRSPPPRLKPPTTDKETT